MFEDDVIKMIGTFMRVYERMINDGFISDVYSVYILSSILSRWYHGINNVNYNVNYFVAISIVNANNQMHSVTEKE